MTQSETLTPEARIQSIADGVGLVMSAKFVPFSQSRNAKAGGMGHDKPWRSLNWRITLHVPGIGDVMETDYAQGEGHAPASKAKWLSALTKARAIEIELETGKRARYSPMTDRAYASPIELSPPSLVDVLGALANDAGAIDHPNYKSWAGDMGYDVDSRRGEAIYRACLETGLKLRAAFGDSHLSRLREAAGEL